MSRRRIAGREAPRRRLPRLVFVFALLVGVAGGMSESAAQDLNDMPTPEDLELGSEKPTEPRAALTIEKPTDRSDVQTPFTVAGSAPAGARLELWLGDELQRVFKADSAGKFTTPVNKQIGPRTKIWIHQVAQGGNRVQSASVRVNWSGEAEARERTFDDPPPPEEEMASESGPEAQNQDLDVFSDDADPANITSAPVPPPVDQVGKKPAPPPPEGEAREIPSGGFSDMGEGADEDDATADESLQQETYVFEKPPPNRFLRGSLEAAGGFAGGVVGGMAGGLLGAGLGVAFADPFAVIAFTALGGLGGAAAGIPVGVIWVGRAMDGNGAIWATILGELTGIIVASAFTAAYTSAALDGTAPALAFIALPITGAVLGYELTSDPSRRQAEQEQGIQAVRPIVAPTADGHGAALGLGFRF